MRASRFALLMVWMVLASACGGGGDGDSADAPPVGPRPSKRTDVASAPANDGSFVVFGGNDGPIVDQIPHPNYLQDTWLYIPTSGWTEITAGGPSTRGRYGVAHDPNADRMLLFGGRFRITGQTGNYTLYNDLWAFDYSASAWSLVHDGSGTAPPPRYFPALAYDSGQNRVIVYGGGLNVSGLVLDPATDVWSFDGNGWTELTPTGEAPSGRIYVGYLYDSARNRLVVHGGNVDFFSPSLADLYAFDIGSSTWTRLHDGVSGAHPSGRFSSMMTYDAGRDRYLLFGGHADAGYENDVWAFDPVNLTWSLVYDGDSFTGAPLGCLGNPAEIPDNYVTQDLDGPERRSGGVFALTGDNILMFGGVTDCADYTDDLWRLNLAQNSWTELIPSRSGESCARRNVACSCLCL